MLTKADDYPIHQRPEPIATSGTDRNFYAAFMLQRNGVQHSLFASRHLESERMDTHVGPIAVEVLEPLQRLRVRVAENEHGLGADLVFAGSAAPLDGGAPAHLRDVHFALAYRRGTRQVASAHITALRPDGGEVRVELECGELVHKEGEGYGHQSWGHGMYHGPRAVHFHALCRVRLELPGEAAR